MAFSATKDKAMPFGALIMQIYSLDFDSVTTGDVETGLQNVLYAAFENEVTEDDGLVKTDSDGSSTVAGQVNISGVTSDDTGKLLVIGN